MLGIKIVGMIYTPIRRKFIYENAVKLPATFNEIKWQRRYTIGPETRPQFCDDCGLELKLIGIGESSYHPISGEEEVSLIIACKDFDRYSLSSVERVPLKTVKHLFSFDPREWQGPSYARDY